MEDYFSVIPPPRYEQDPPRTPPHRIISSGVAPLIQEVIMFYFATVFDNLF